MSEEIMNTVELEADPVVEIAEEAAPVLSMPENKKCIEKELKIYKKVSKTFWRNQLIHCHQNVF